MNTAEKFDIVFDREYKVINCGGRQLGLLLDNRASGVSVGGQTTFWFRAVKGEAGKKITGRVFFVSSCYGTIDDNEDLFVGVEFRYPDDDGEMCVAVVRFNTKKPNDGTAWAYFYPHGTVFLRTNDEGIPVPYYGDLFAHGLTKIFIAVMYAQDNPLGRQWTNKTLADASVHATANHEISVRDAERELGRLAELEVMSRIGDTFTLKLDASAFRERFGIKVWTLPPIVVKHDGQTMTSHQMYNAMVLLNQLSTATYSNLPHANNYGWTRCRGISRDQAQSLIKGSHKQIEDFGLNHTQVLVIGKFDDITDPGNPVYKLTGIRPCEPGSSTDYELVTVTFSYLD
jgi:hypothetical protein